MPHSIAEFSVVGVVGAGQMGQGIAQVCASHGLSVRLYDSAAAQLTKAKDQIAGSLRKLVEKEKIDRQVESAAHAGLSYHSALSELKNCDLVIEAIIENETIKGQLFKELGELLQAKAILASNTSSIPITRLASYSGRPGQFIGMHFMNPVPIMKLVEVISGMATDTETLRRITELALGLGKEVSASQDYPGFVVNRVLMPMINEAFYALQEGVASAEDIDKGLKLGCNQPMGPLTLADFIGLDTCHAIMNVIYDGTKDPRHRPSPLLAKYVEAGYFGRKSGRGVYRY